MELTWFLVGVFFAICALPVIESIAEWIKYIFAKFIACKEIEVQEMQIKFNKAYGNEELQSQIGFNMSDDKIIDEQEDIYDKK